MNCLYQLNYVVYFNATAFTLTNVYKVLEGVDWERVCGILDIYGSKQRELEASFPDTERRREEAIKFWMTNDPLASWRRLVDQLYRWNEYALGDRVRHYCKDLTGMCIHTTPHHE